MPLPEDIAAVVRRPGGAPGTRCLALLHGAACAGRFDAVPALLPLAPALGVERAALLETALQVVAYGGFPRAIELLTHLRAGTPPPPGTPRADGPATQGRAVWDSIYARQADEVLATLEALHPGFSRVVLEDAYGRILARPGLPLAERELLAVAALTLMALPAPLGSHIRGALRNGCNATAVMDILDTCRVLADPAALQVLEQAQDRLSRSVYRP